MATDIPFSATMPRHSRVPGLADIRTPPMAYDALVLSDSPEAFWKLNELSGTTAIDATGHGHDGTYVGTPTLGQTGLIDYAARFGTAGQRVTVASATNFPTTGNYTVEAIICNENVGVIFGYGAQTVNQANLLIVPSTNQLGEHWWTNTYNQATTGFMNTWHHVASTWDGSLRRIYLDGVLQGTGNTPGASPNFQQSTVTIAASIDASQVFVGRLQRVAIYNTALSATKLLAHKKAAFGW